MKPQDTTTHRRLISVLAILLIIAMLGVVSCITIDGKSYYLQLRSIIYGGDVSYYDEMLYHYEGYEPDHFVVDVLPSGYVPNVFPLGFAILLTPFFLLGHGLGIIIHSIGWGPSPNGYSFPEVLLTLVVSAGLGSLGLWLTGKIVARFYGVKAALWATMGLWLASPLPAYLYAQPSFAHSLSVFTSCLVLIIWLSATEHQIIKRGLALGLAIGLATIVRWQDGTFLLFPLCDLFRFQKQWKFRDHILYSLITGFGFLIAVFPQLLLWKIQFGNWITIPQGQGFMRWWDPQIIPVLFAARHGLISWTPIIAISFLGFIALAFRRPKIGVPLLLLLLVQIYVNSIVLDWWAGWGFGGRRFLDLIPFFILVTAFLFNELSEQWKKFIPFVVGALIIWNASLLYHYFTGHVDFGGNVPFSEWCRQNWILLTHQPWLLFGGTIIIIAILWLISQLTRFSVVEGSKRGIASGQITSRHQSPKSFKLRWLPSNWVILLTIGYLVIWSLNLTRTSINVQRIQVLNQEPKFRDWITVAYRPPFQGSGFEDIIDHQTLWNQFASWSVKPGGTWKLVTACDGNLSIGDTAAILSIEAVDNKIHNEPLVWGIGTGPNQIPAKSSSTKSTATIARCDLPLRIKAMPYRTFKPLPWSLANWIRFIRDYSQNRIPMDAAYEFTFSLPDDFTPKRFELHLQEARQCYIYGIGRVESP
jgi:hypothetical protein